MRASEPLLAVPGNAALQHRIESSGGGISAAETCALVKSGGDRRLRITPVKGIVASQGFKGP